MSRGLSSIIDPAMFCSGRKEKSCSIMLSTISLTIEPAELSNNTIESAFDGGQDALAVLLHWRLLHLSDKFCCWNLGSWFLICLKMQPDSVA